VATSYSNTVSNIAFSIACLVFIAFGAIRIEERLTGKTATPRIPEPIEAFEDQSLLIEDAQTMGSPTAEVVLVEFSDFQCPYCRQHNSDSFETIKKEFVETGRIRQAFMHLALPSHPQAKAAAEAAECAGKQGRFWEMRMQLFTNQSLLNTEDAIANLGDDLQIDWQDFKRCLQGETSATVVRHISAAKELGLTSTPSFVIGRQRKDGRLELSKKIVGAHNIEVFRTAIKDALETK
jgi:protein-disulfide isomerase